MRKYFNQSVRINYLHWYKSSELNYDISLSAKKKKNRIKEKPRMTYLWKGSTLGVLTMPYNVLQQGLSYSARQYWGWRLDDFGDSAHFTCSVTSAAWT